MTFARARGPLCALVFILLALTVLPHAGVQTDEALFAGIIFQPYESLDFFRAFHHSVPTMLMSYVGALKTWLYYPIFQLFPPGVWSLRLPMVLLGGCSVWLFTLFLAKLHGERAAWFGGLLMATDPILLLTTTFDWGPVAIQHFLLLAAGVLLLRPALWSWCLAFFCLGLALWNKALVTWTFIGFALPLLALFPALLWRTFHWKRLLLALAFFVLGAFPFLRYNVRKPAATVSQNVNLTFDELAPKSRLLYETFRGYALMEYITYEPKSPQRWTYVPLALLAAMILLLIWPSRLGWLPIIAGAITFLLMAVTKNAGGAVHHQVLIFPLQYWAIAAAFTAPKISRPTFAWVVVALLALDNARVLNIYRQSLVTEGSPASWTNAIFRLADRLQAQPKPARIYDWGMTDNLTLLTRGKVPLVWTERPFPPASLAAPDTLWVGTIKPFEAFANINQDFQQAVEAAGMERVNLETITDRRGRPVYEVFELRAKR